MLGRARRLRAEMTPQEELLWSCLRDRRMGDYKFRRQMWLTGYIADFACPQARLVVEADGSQHADNPDYDEARSKAFERVGWLTLRFWNNEIANELEAVLTAIRAAVLSREEGPSPGQPSAGHPLPKMGEG
jgi:very-short-patch-repair endonuclease